MVALPGSQAAPAGTEEGGTMKRPASAEKLPVLTELEEPVSFCPEYFAAQK